MALPDSIVNATISAYYPQALAEATAARGRAQSGYAIAGAVAAALTAAGLLSDLGQQSLAAQITGYAALAAWLGCALLFLRAVATAAPAQKGSTESADEFVTEILGRAKADHDLVVTRTSWAIRLAFLAVALTFAAIVLGFTTGDDAHDLTGRLVLTNSGNSAMAAACGTVSGSITATIDEHALDKSTVRFTLPSGCHRQRPATLLLPRSAIAGFVVTRTR